MNDHAVPLPFDFEKAGWVRIPAHDYTSQGKKLEAWLTNKAVVVWLDSEAKSLQVGEIRDEPPSNGPVTPPKPPAHVSREWGD
jgi:hypothetical protein